MYLLLVLLLVGLACALPKPAPQGFDFDMIDAAPDPTTEAAPAGATSSIVANTNSAALASSVMSAMATDPATTFAKRTIIGRAAKTSNGCEVQPTGYGPIPSPDTADGFTNDQDFAKRTIIGRAAKTSNGCEVQPTGYGPIPSPDTADGFTNDQDFANTALSVPTPQGFSLTFSNLSASTQSTDLLSYTTLKSYDPIICQQYCDSLTNCYGINIYYERDPKINPCNLANADGPSTTVIKCVAWGSQASLDPALATNDGQYRGPASNVTNQPFHVVIAASNGYTKNSPPPRLNGFIGPISTGGAINAPFLPNGTNTYLGAKIFAGVSYDPAICAAACTAQTTYNLAHPRSDGSSSSCVFFNVFLLSVDNVPQGLYCSLYTVGWGRGYGTNFGQSRTGSDGVSRRYEVSQSYAYTLGG